MLRKVFKGGFKNEKFETEAFQSMNEKESDQDESDGSLSPTNESDNESDENQVDEDDESDGDPKEDNGRDDEDEQEPDGDSEDEAPESVDFSESRKNILSQVRSAMMQVGQEKQRQKEKRKMQEILFKEQKEKKMKYMNDRKLPDDVLESIEEVIPKDKNHKKQIEKKKRKEDVSKTATESVKAKEKGRSKKGQKVTFNPAGDLTDDYIPLVDEQSGVEVTEINQFEKQHKSLAQRAADFRNSRLYGKDTPRESNKSRMLKLEKKRHR